MARKKVSLEETPLPPLGTSAWVEAVFESPPVRKNKGRSKYTQYHERQVEGHPMGAQGRVEYCALLCALYLRTTCLVRRIKEQPFATTAEEFGAEIVPDFLIESTNGSVHIVEVKTARFITRERESLLDANRRKFEEFGLDYQVWTDVTPLNHATRHHLIRMSMAASEPVEEVEIDSLISYVKQRPLISLSHLFSEGFDLNCIYKAVNKGRLHFPLSAPFSKSTPFATYPLLDLRGAYLSSRRSCDSWWAAL